MTITCEDDVARFRAYLLGGEGEDGWDHLPALCLSDEGHPPPQWQWRKACHPCWVALLAYVASEPRSVRLGDFYFRPRDVPALAALFAELGPPREAKHDAPPDLA